MTEEAAFLDAIRAAPQDDAPRLIYADWLSEQLDEVLIAQGEFIRTQIARAACPEWTREWHDLHLREEALKGEGLLAWEAPYRALGAAVDEYDRGLPCRLRLDAETLVSHRAILVDLTPGWTGLSLHGTGDALAEALAEPPPQGIVHFGFHASDFETRATDADAAAVARSGWLDDAKSLSLAGSGFGPAVEVILSAAAAVGDATIVSLDLSGNELDEAAARELSGHPVFESLHALDVSGNPLGDDLPTLLSSCRSGVLRSLRMGSLDQVDVRTLLLAPTTPTLEELYLINNPLDDQAAALFSSDAPLASLRRLSLVNTGLTASDLKPSWPTNPQGGLFSGALQQLDLSYNHLSDRAIVALLSSRLADGLRSLALTMTYLTDAGAAALANNPRLAALRRLHVGANWLTSVGDATLRQSPHLQGLLDLQTTAKWKTSSRDGGR